MALAPSESRSVRERPRFRPRLGSHESCGGMEFLASSKSLGACGGEQKQTHGGEQKQTHEHCEAVTGPSNSSMHPNNRETLSAAVPEGEIEGNQRSHLEVYSGKKGPPKH